MSTPNGQGWVVPRSGEICLVVPDNVGFGISCANASEVAAGKLIGFFEPTSPGGSTVVVGLVPKDANAAVLRRDGTKSQVPVQDGIISATVTDASQIQISSSDGVSVGTLAAVS
jgi:hypothetical protein